MRITERHQRRPPQTPRGRRAHGGLAPDGFPYFSVPTHPTPTSTGPVQLPVMYYDGSAVTAFFTVDNAVAASLTDPTLGECVRVGGRAVVGLACYEYRRTSIGPYNEVGLGVMIHEPWQRHPVGAWIETFRRADRRRSGCYVVDLPVTTEEANAAGHDIWGLPKFVTPIDFSLLGHRVEVIVADPGDQKPIMTFSGELGPGIPTPRWDLVLYSRREDTALRTLLDVRASVRAHLAPRARLLVGGSEHPMAKRLQDLGLDGARPILCLSAPTYQARLGGGAAIAGSGKLEDS